ncbi:hypothetical protein [Microvirga sp. VF16]|uniref:hypothetical protein n=1 Tax=Microvirga sp. VF16 TaxID=2807101 RepID=UPI001FEEBE74|nr:hypothetical protein [Microvirga sp. VF16]
MGVSFKTLMGAGFILVGAVAFQTAPAEAQRGWGRYEGDYYAPHGLRQRYYAPRYYGGARYGYYGRRGYYGGRYGYGYPYGYYRRPNYGGAVAAGVIGGLALGAIASAAANPYYGPAYYAPPRCAFERRRVVNPYGRVVVRRIRTCY